MDSATKKLIAPIAISTATPLPDPEPDAAVAPAPAPATATDGGADGGGDGLHVERTVVRQWRAVASGRRRIEPEDGDYTAGGVMPSGGRKMTIVGCGQVGLAIAYAAINQGLMKELALVDMNKEKLEGETQDLLQGSHFFKRRVTISCSSTYEVSAESHLVIITAGVRQRVGESRLSLLERNTRVMQSIVPEVVKYSPGAAICVVSNPCDVMAAIAAKIAKLPPGRVFGSGTALDTSRLQSLVAAKFDLDARNVHGYVVGEHGDSSVAVWSSLNLGGLPLVGEEGPTEEHRALHKKVVEAAGDVIAKKGYTNWAVGLAVAHIARAILQDETRILPVSTCVNGYAGISKDVFLSVPCVLGARGVERVIELRLSDEELTKFRGSADSIWEVQSGVWDTL